MNVNKNTRAGKNGKCLACPHCGHKVIVFHFAWCASSCATRAYADVWDGCGEMIEKNDWLVVG